MNFLLKTQLFRLATFVALFFFMSCGGCKGCKGFKGCKPKPECVGCSVEIKLPENLTYVNVEVLDFKGIEEGAVPDAIQEMLNVFLKNLDNGVVPTVTLKSAANNKLAYVITRKLEKEDGKLNGNINNVKFVKTTTLNEILPSVSIPKEFSQPFNVKDNLDVLSRYQAEMKKGVTILFNTDAADTTPNVLHTSEELVEKISEYVSQDERNIKIYFNMPFVNPDVALHWEEKRIEEEQEAANNNKDVAAKKLALDRVNSAIESKLIQNNQNAHLWYLRAINRTYARVDNEAIDYLRTAALLSIPDSALNIPDSSYQMNHKITSIEGTKLKFLKDHRTSKFKALKNALSKKDRNLIDIYMREAQLIPGTEDYFVHLEISNDTYANALKGYKISTLNNEGNNNLSVTVAVPEGVNKTLRTMNFTLPYGEVETGFYDNGNWEYMISNESPTDKNYVKLRFHFKKVKSQNKPDGTKAVPADDDF